MSNNSRRLRSKRLVTRSAAFLFATIGLPQAASAATQITACPYVINLPGQYRLDVDCSVPPGGAGIVIQADNVHLNLRGHTISGPGAFGGGPSVSTSVGIALNASDVHINNGTVKALTIGIQVAGNPGDPATHNHLNGLTVRENITGLQLQGNDNRVTGCDISANVEGVLLRAANHNVIESNVINENGFSPFAGGGGVRMETNADDNTIAYNEISHNHDTAVLIQAGGNDHNTIRGNIIEGTVAAGAITIQDSNNTIQENRAIGNPGGIAIFSGASMNLVQGNTSLGNVLADLSDGNPNCDGNTWTNNTFAIDLVLGASDGGPGTGCIQ
jgi:parallel beta-helix repeat protein